MRRTARRAAALAVVLALGGCGGSSSEAEHAGLDRAEAKRRVEAALERAQERGDVARSLGRALAGGSAGRMGRLGGSDLRAAARRVSQVSLEPGSREGREVWVATYAVAGAGSSLALCVWVGGEADAVGVRARC